MQQHSVSQHKGEQGFSLIEGMLAAAILSVGLLAMSGMQTISLVKNVDANESTLTTAMAADILERIQFNRRSAVSYNGIDTGDPANPSPTNNCSNIINQPQAKGDCLLWDSLVKGSTFQNIRGVVAVSTAVIAPTSLNQRNVTVTMTWTANKNGDRTSRPRSLTLNRVVAPE